MSETYIEKRIIKAGIDLCKRRIEQKGSMITAEDLMTLEIRTFSPAMTGFYFVTGFALVVFGIWVQIQLETMIYSFLPMLVGVGNCGYALWGRPRKVRELKDEVNIMSLSADITRRFVDEMDAKRK